MRLDEFAMSGIGILENCVLDYPWGSAVEIPRLLGLENPTGGPMAELWMGAHPKAPSWVRREAGWVPLNRLIEAFPEEILGRAAAARFGNRLPFLFKVLAAAEPLSIQAHPSLAQAAEGFERETRQGLPFDSSGRNFRDANHKPELLCALTPFWVMCGFRAPGEILDRLARLCPQELAPELARLKACPHAAGLKRFFHALLTMKETSPGRCRRLVEEAQRNAGRLNGRESRWVGELAARYEADIGVLGPALLNVFCLEPGEALFLPAGIIHSYLSGTGVEIMANSDNVVRGGLTTKHMDVELLMSVARFDGDQVIGVNAEAAGPSEQRYAAPVEEFALSVIRLRPGAAFTSRAERQVEILLCTGGAAALSQGEGAGALELKPGVSLLVAAAAAPYRLAGEATVFKATLPEA
jgi:mannose-6-phosphate isomerase